MGGNSAKPKALCVFCASSNAVDTEFLNTARELGRLMGRRGLDLVYGGASIGLMGEVARGVHDEGGRVTGVLPEFFLKKEIKYDEADELIVTEDMRERKAEMDARSDAFIVLPGGIGTLEEALEIMSMVQLRLTHKPLVFINTQGFFDGLLAHIRHLVELRFAKTETLSMFAVEPNPEEALDFIERYQPPELHSKWL